MDADHRFLPDDDRTDLDQLQADRGDGSASQGSAFESIAPQRICRVSYETFVANPAEELRRIASFMSVELDRPDAEKLVHGVLRASVGKGRQEFGDEMVERLEHLVGSTLKRHGYLS